MPGYFIVNAVPDDFNSICLLFEEAIQFQQQNNYTGWESYDKNYIKLVKKIKI